MTNPSDYGWGPGWPNCQTSKIVWLTRSDGFRQPFRREIVTLLAWLMDETERRGYNIRPDWSWGFNCREIRGYPGVPSLHSWGLAIDINAPVNPMMGGSPGWQWLHDHGRTDMPQWLPALWGAHGFGWGGDYLHRQDAMHLEAMVSPADIARITAGLSAKPNPVLYLLDHTLHVGERGAVSGPGLWMGDKLGQMIGHVQDELRFFAIRYHAPDCNPGPTDGYYGVGTGLASHCFKTRMNFFQPTVFKLPADTTFGARSQAAADWWNHAP